MHRTYIDKLFSHNKMHLETISATTWLAYIAPKQRALGCREELWWAHMAAADSLALERRIALLAALYAWYASLQATSQFSGYRL